MAEVRPQSNGDWNHYDRFTDDLATGDPYDDEWETPPRPSTVTPSIEEHARV